MTVRVITTAAVGGLIVLGSATVTEAQHRPGSVERATGQVAAFAPGVIQGVVKDHDGEPVAGVVVSALGAATRIAVTSEDGRYEFTALPPGPYVLRAISRGFITPPPLRVNVTANGRAISAFSLQAAGSAPLMLAGVGVAAAPQITPEPVTADSRPTDDGELEWRLRYLRRGMLRETSDGLYVDARVPEEDQRALAMEVLSRAVTVPARAATDFFTDTVFTGQVNILTTGSFDADPTELMLRDSLANSVANVRVGAPIGTAGSWEVRGGMTQSDVSAWMVAGSYGTKTDNGHAREIGVSFSAQRYDGRNPLAPPDPMGGTRNVGSVYAFDSFGVTRDVTLTYGGRYARYDYLDVPDLVSPRVEMNANVGDLRVGGVVSLRAHAPGAEEFLPPSETGIWLPPQRTFSALDPASGLHAERGLHTSVRVERDVADITLGVRAFHERVNDQLLTVFGSEMPGAPSSSTGHYFVGNAGTASAFGCTMEMRSALSKFARAAVAYTYTRATLEAPSDVQYLVLLSPSLVRTGPENLHDVSARFEADVPDTATRVIVLFRVGNGYAQADANPRRTDPSRPDLDSRFDVQLRQTVPFMNFTRARLEMLLAVRNFFREAGVEQSVYDELLAVQPPKRIVGGVTLHF